jgi:hypothetical protein
MHIHVVGSTEPYEKKALLLHALRKKTEVNQK